MPGVMPKNLREMPGAGDFPVSIVIPLFNEERIIEDNLASLANFFDRLLGPRNWLFILVDNGSTDRTPELVRAAVERWPLSRVVNLAEPNYGAALKAGLRAATTKWVFMLDIEQWDLPFLVWAWNYRSYYDAFIASKRADPSINHQEPYRRLLSCGLNALLQVLFGFTGTDTHGPKLLNRVALQSIIEVCQLDRGQFDTELVLRAMRSGKRIVEAPMEYRELRPARNWMVKKIVWNIFALRRLVRVMKNVPFDGPTRYYRFAREDVLAESSEPMIAARERGVV
jgi:glycosyltransferase involved in cell wall biosynthesis